MSDVQFEENNDTHFRSRTILGQPQTPKMVNFIMKFGIKDEKKAGHVLLGITILFILIAIGIILQTGSKSNADPKKMEELFNTYQSQGYTGQDLIDKIDEARAK